MAGFLDAIDSTLAANAAFGGARVPIGKKIRLYRCPDGSNPTPILENHLILGEDLVLNVDSTFSPVMNSSAGLVGGVVGGVTGINPNAVRVVGSATAFEGRFKQQSIHIWESTSPLSFSVTIALYMDYDGEKQVMTPTRELMKLVLPKETTTKTGTAGLLMPPGPSASFALSSMIGAASEETAAKLGDFLKNETDFVTYKIVIGNYLFLDSIVITRAEPIISSEADSNGKPIWAKVRLDIQTTTACTQQMIDDFNVAATFKENEDFNATLPAGDAAFKSTTLTQFTS